MSPAYRSYRRKFGVIQMPPMRCYQIFFARSARSCRRCAFSISVRPQRFSSPPTFSGSLRSSADVRSPRSRLPSTFSGSFSPSAEVRLSLKSYERMKVFISQILQNSSGTKGRGRRSAMNLNRREVFRHSAWSGEYSLPYRPI